LDEELPVRPTLLALESVGSANSLRLLVARLAWTLATCLTYFLRYGFLFIHSWYFGHYANVSARPTSALISSADIDTPESNLFKS
jgi:hypothetical protein